MASGGSTRVVIAALLANLGIALTKGIAAALTGSAAMLAETIHSVADSGNQALLLLGAHRSRRPADARHPFGYGMERYFWAFVVAIVLFALGALFSLYEGVHKLLAPEPIQRVAWAYGVLLVALALESASFVVARREIRSVARGRTFLRFLFASKAPSVPLVFLEDLGALLGLLFAFAGVTGSHWFGWIRADAVATLLVGVLLACIAALLLVRCHRLLVGEAASEEDRQAILAATRSVEGVGRVAACKTLHIGPETLLVVLDLEFAGGLRTVLAVEAAIRARVPYATYISVEPAS